MIGYTQLGYFGQVVPPTGAADFVSAINDLAAKLKAAGFDVGTPPYVVNPDGTVAVESGLSAAVRVLLDLSSFETFSDVKVPLADRRAVAIHARAVLDKMTAPGQVPADLIKNTAKLAAAVKTQKEIAAAMRQAAGKTIPQAPVRTAKAGTGAKVAIGLGVLAVAAGIFGAYSD